MTTPAHHAIAVLGTGLVCNLGRGVDAVYATMCRGETGFRPLTRFPAAAYAQQHAGQLAPEVEAQLRADFGDEDLAAAMVKTAGLEALPTATQPHQPLDPELGLVLATNFGAMETQQWCWRERHDMGTLDAETFRMVDRFLPDIASYFGCGGPTAQLSLSCASGAAAVALGRDWILAGRARRVLTIAFDCLTEYCWCGLSNLRTITSDRLRPFDLNRAGTIFSEGAAAMLLAHPHDAAATAPLAWLRGAAVNNNAFHMTAPAKDAEGSRQVLATALASAGLGSADVDHVCAHATGTTANDCTEVACLQNLFGAEHLATLTVAAHKSQLGHMMGAAGLAEAVITVQVLRHALIPPTMHYETPDPACAVDCIAGTARAKAVRLAITNSAGIGGNNAALVLGKA